VGNGLSIDLFEYLDIGVFPSSPFSFNVPFKGKKLLGFLPNLGKMLESNKGKKDYDIISARLI
jgi:hypothetical protein